jgi:hypothetical protein
MTALESTHVSKAAVTVGQVAGPKGPIGHPVVSFDASRGRRTRLSTQGGVASLLRRLFGGGGK